MMLNEWQMLSNHPMPPAQSSVTQATVRMMYTVHISLVVMLIFGCNLSCSTPVASALNNCRLPPPKIGSRAMVKHTMPKPPTHCVRARQKSMPRGMVSRWSTTVKPVVVKPDIVSKKAPATEGISPLNKNGTMPSSVNISHVRVTMQ